MKEITGRDSFIERIQEKDFDKNALAETVLTDECYRKLSVENMIENPKIMVYYHCYEVLKEATRRAPGKFETYKSDFVALLNHDNSYHRDFGLSLLSNLVAGSERVDFHEFSQDYFARLNDTKMMTAECCLKNLKQIIENRKEYTDVVTGRVMQKENFAGYKEKQRELIYSFVIDLLETAFANGYDKDPLTHYVSDKLESPSPKTRKTAKRLHKKLVS